MKFNDRIIRRSLIVIALGGLALGIFATLVGHPALAGWAWNIGTIPLIAALAYTIVRDLRAGRMGVDLLALLSMAAALALGEALAGVIVAVMYASGQALEDYAVGRAERDLKTLIDRAPRLAHRKHGDNLEDVPIDQIAVWDSILVRAGEVVPIDGQVCSASALIDESVLTGEPIPVMRQAGEAVSSGTINVGESFEMRATATAGDSAYAGIVRMVTAAQTAKAPFMRMADHYALLLLPITLCLTGVTWWLSRDPVRALAVLVTATPCPLILAAPAAFIGGTSQAARRGILVKGSGPLETMARIRTVMFDKTGTLTVGGARLVAVETASDISPTEALRLAASLEQASHHVLAATIVSIAHEKSLALRTPIDVREVLGSGLEGVIEGQKVSVGSLELVHGEGRLEEWARRAARRASWRSALTVFVAVDGRVIAVLLFADELRRETPRAIQALRRAGVAKIVMVTGDRAEPAETIGSALDLDAVLAERVPSDKVDAVVMERRRAPTLMVGDGINDAPALAAADVGLAMGARGASASSEAADVVILVDRLDRVAEAVAIARRTRTIALQSMIAGMGLSGVTMVAAAFGYVPPVAGALIQEVIDVAVILNALRALAPPGAFDRAPMAEAAATVLREAHERLEPNLERLRQIADALDAVKPDEAVNYVLEANRIIKTTIVTHERADEEAIYPRVSSYLNDSHGLSAMSRAHREILHQARLLERLVEGLAPSDAEPYLIRDAQRIIETIESLVHIHNAQEEDIYEHAAAQLESDGNLFTVAKPGSVDPDSAKIFDRALESRRGISWKWRTSVAFLLILGLGTGVFYWKVIRGTESHVTTRTDEHEGKTAEIISTGVIEPSSSVWVDAHVSGIVQKLYCDAGSKVSVGQICARIDPLPFQIIVDRSKSDVAASTIRLKESEARLERARDVFENAKRRIRGYTEPSKTVENLRMRVDRAQAEVARDKASARSDESVLQAALNALNLTEIASPVDGVVISRLVELGRSTARNQTPLFLVTKDPTAVKITAKLGEDDFRFVRIGDRVSFTVEGQPGRLFEGVVSAITSTQFGAPGVSTVDVTITAFNPDFLLKAGMMATLKINVGKRV